MDNSEHHVWLIRYVRVSAVLLVVYLVGVALLTTVYPSTRFAEPVRIGRNMYMSGTDEVYHGRLVVSGWPIPFYVARTEPPEPNTQSPQITVAWRFSVAALAADLLFVMAVAGIVVAGQFASSQRQFSIRWLLAFATCVAVLVGVAAAARVPFLDPIPVYEEQHGSPCQPRPAGE